jgi:hypothetical protein
MRKANVSTMVTFVHGVARGTLCLKRFPLPRFLRFVFRNNDWGTLDALDQLDDMPQDSEYLIAAELDPTCSGSVHLDYIDKHGHRASQWSKTETYRTVCDQPLQEVMRSTVAWRSWCTERLGLIASNLSASATAPPPKPRQ